MQKKRSILSNFPLLGRFRFFLESIRPELRQYYWESDDDEEEKEEMGNMGEKESMQELDWKLEVASGKCAQVMSLKGSVVEFNVGEYEENVLGYVQFGKPEELKRAMEYFPVHFSPPCRHQLSRERALLIRGPPAQQHAME